ncbi:MAG TPA: sodium:solute symporter [Candidatus Nesterenkonia stercoripullorum]|uniref:Sodium:solute symporter n=1 Tax=Candidatus Nesterenkonia stercoripullorum TaxID=2838701 RepID=A0A9D2A750_9MICC|nr:sodium:solute symporter [Candidatus Nesterenkonia stercoripullorum]
MESLNIIIIVIYLVAMLGFGWWGRRRTKNASDYLVAGRRLGPLLYTGTMSAVILGGASTIGGVGLGYTYGISGVWLVTAIGVGVLILSLLFAPTLRRLKVYTVSQMLTLRYGSEATKVSSVVMLGYTLMLAATSTGAYASIFVVLFGWDRWLSILVGGGIVLIYAVVGGMWSITLADFVQFGIMTVGLFLVMLPFSLASAGGWSGLTDRLDAEFFDLGGIGLQSIITYFVVYTLGLLIGQDVWQRVFTARTPAIARWGGAAAGVYTILYGLAGAIIGMAAAVVMTGIENSDDVFAAVATDMLPIGIGGIAMAAAVAAMMSTASGALIAAATVARADVVPLIRGLIVGRGVRRYGAAEVAAEARRQSGEDPADSAEDRAERFERDISSNRRWVLIAGVFVLGLAILVPDVVSALTIAYAILVGGLLVAILGALVWQRGTGAGAAWSMVIGALATLGTMTVLEIQASERFAGINANEPIYFGLLSSAVVYTGVSLLTRPTDPEILAAWQYRTRYGTDRDFVPGSDVRAAIRDAR